MHSVITWAISRALPTILWCPCFPGAAVGATLPFWWSSDVQIIYEYCWLYMNFICYVLTKDTTFTLEICSWRHLFTFFFGTISVLLFPASQHGFFMIFTSFVGFVGFVVFVCASARACALWSASAWSHLARWSDLRDLGLISFSVHLAIIIVIPLPTLP